MIKGTGILREFNKRKILSLIRKYGKTSRQDLVDKMGVSKNTVSMIVDELMKQNILEEIGEKELGKKGRPKIIIQIKGNSLKSIGISISKYAIDYSVINYYGSVMESSSFKYDCTDPFKTKKRLIGLINDLTSRYTQLIGVGIGIPAIVESETKYIHESTHLGWDNVSLEELNDISLPVIIRNSINMGAIQASEKHQSQDESLFYIRVSEGVGGAYVVDNALIDGGSWTAGEIGHISIDTNGDSCLCGQKGCLEQLVNFNAIKRDLKQIGVNPPTEINNNLTFDEEHLNSNEVKALMMEYGNNFGKALIYVVHLLNPSKVILDTPYNTFEEFKKSCLLYIKGNALEITIKNTEVVFKKQRDPLSRGAALSVINIYEMEI